MIEHLDTGSGSGRHDGFGTDDSGDSGAEQLVGGSSRPPVAWAELAAGLTAILGPVAPVRGRDGGPDRWPSPVRPVLTVAGVWAGVLAVVAIIVPLLRQLAPTITEPRWPGIVPVPLLGIVLVALVVVVGLVVTPLARRWLPRLFGRQPILAFLVSTAIVAMPTLGWWWWLWSDPVAVMAVGPWLSRLVLLAGPMLVLGAVMALHATVAAVLATARAFGGGEGAATTRRSAILPSPAETLLVAGAAWPAVLGGWFAGFAVLVLAVVVVRAVQLRRWRLVVLAGATGLVLLNLATGLLADLPTRLVGYGIAAALVLGVALTRTVRRRRPTRRGVLACVGLLSLVALAAVSDALTVPWPVLLAELFGVPLPWSGVLVVLGLGWWALLALARPRTGPRTAIVVLALTQLGLVAAIVCGMTAGAPGTDLWPHLQVAGAVAVGLTATLGWAAVGPDPGHTATSVPGQGSEDRRRLDPKRPVIVGLIGVLLITMATLTAPLPRPDPTVAAASYVPRDGAGAAIMWRSSGESSAGQLENRRAEHPAALDERFAGVPDPSHGLWWEEWISGGDRRWSIDVDAGSGQVSAEMIDSDRVRLMTVTGQGIELRGMTGLNAGTVLLSPGAVLLPADPDDGSRWRGSGTAELVTTGGQMVPMEFEMSGFIVRGGNALPLVRRAHRTCRVAAVELDLRPTDGSRFAAMTITDQSWWCPDRGVALQYGEVDGSEYMMSQLGDLRMQPGADLDDATRPGGPGVPPIAGELRRTRMICPGGLEIPQVPTRTGRSGDTILPGGHLLSTTVGSPRVSVTDHGLSWWPTSRRDRCQARTPKQHHPGGVVLGAWDMGALIAVASSDATLTAYGTESGRLWQSELSAVPRVAPVRVGSAIAVLGTDDTLTLLDFESGEVRAEVAIPGARTVTASTGANLATARAAVADRTGRVSFVSADGTLTGRLRAPAAAEHRMVGIDQPQLVSWTSTGVEVRAQSGTLSWQQDRPIDDLTVLEDSGHGPVLLVRDATGLTALAADSGQVVWTHAPVQQVAPITDGVLLLDDLGVQVLDGLGRVVTTLALPADVPVERITVSATDRIVWIVWTDDAGVTRMTGYLPR